VQRDKYDPKLILLVRRVRVRPTLIFQGRVIDNPAPVQNAAAKPTTSPQPGPPAANDSIVDRVRAFFRRIFS
jgi:hypothetical protein